MGDPRYNPADPVTVNPPTPDRTGIFGTFPVGQRGIRPLMPSSLRDRTGSWCLVNDVICNTPRDADVAARLAECWLLQPACPHVQYRNWGVAADVGKWLARQATTRLTPPAPPQTSPHLCVALVADATVPDNAQVQAGATVTKTWRVRNCGNTDWAQLTATRTDGAFGPETFPVPALAPGAVADIGMTFVAPAGPGTFRATYRLRSSTGQFADNTFWVQITVPTDAAASAQPAVPPPATTTPPRAQPTPPPVVPGDKPPTADPGQPPLPPGATTLGGVALDRHCAGRGGMSAVLRFPNAWGWRCSPSSVPAGDNRAGDQHISVDDVCVEQYGAGARSRYRTYTDAGSWFCWRQ